MSRCTIIKDCEIPGVEFNKATDDIQGAIDENEKCIEYWKSKLRALVCCTPKDMFNGEDVFFQINQEFDDIFDCLSEAFGDRARLGIIDLNKQDIVNQYEKISTENTKD